MLIPMQLARIVMLDSEEDKLSMIVLREVDGDRAFPILIGLPEALAIKRRSNRETAARPMTHDLIAGMIDQLDCSLEQIVIHELRDSTFYAKIVIRCDDELIEVDSRPSDAIAVGAGLDVPILVDDSVLEVVC